MSKNQDLMYVETADEEQWRITGLSSDTDGNYRPPIAHKKKGVSDPSDQVPDKEPTKDVPADELSSRIERLVLEESSHTPSKPTSANADSSESLPIADPDKSALPSDHMKEDAKKHDDSMESLPACF